MDTTTHDATGLYPMASTMTQRIAQVLRECQGKPEEELTALTAAVLAMLVMRPPATIDRAVALSCGTLLREAARRLRGGEVDQPADIRDQVDKKDLPHADALNAQMRMMYMTSPLPAWARASSLMGSAIALCERAHGESTPKQRAAVVTMLDEAARILTRLVARLQGGRAQGVH